MFNIEDKINKLKEEKLILEKISNYKNIINSTNDKLYVKVNGLGDICSRSILSSELVDSLYIDNLISDNSLYIDTINDTKNHLDNNNLDYVDISIDSIDNGLFLDGRVYLNEIIKLYKIEYNILFDNTKYNDEINRFIKSVSKEDFYSDVVVINPYLRIFELDGNSDYESNLGEVVVHFNDYVDNILKNNYKIYYNEYLYDKSNLSHFDILLNSQRTGYGQYFDVTYENPNYYNNVDEYSVLKLK